MEKADMHWKCYQEDLVLHSQLGRYDLLRSTSDTPRVSTAGRHPDQCGCGLPNTKYCMLNVQPLFTSVGPQRHGSGRKKYVWVPMSICSVFSSSTPTVPYSTADILYGNEVRQSPQVDDIRQNSFIDYNPKDRERLGSRDLSDQSGRRPGSKGGSRKSLSIEKVSFGKESEDNLRPILPSTKQTNHYRPNGLRSSLLKGEPLFSSRSHTSGKDADDLIAMGTIWSPGAQPQSQPPQKNLSGPSQTTNGPGKTITVGTGSNSSTTLSQTRKYGSNVKPIMVQNAPASGMKNNVKDGKLDPKYTDPLVGAPASFQQRLMELSALEAETVRYERSKKVKKKVKQDRDS
ncbi:uncharacterized protein LOC110442007 isoform X5 [Mizuhopecten yessoensis]|uniref:Uncharacterized protein n=1 Tax=Mizuhopecten yessoensis TaxID=6573 RepID=A0A210PI51_MIZYE|nr:uncharacterized protein LOC110442007 isoform X5 [Mizuhopecten yessoensis]OWF36174.1 hypothetical protein KP79_PYT09029 [Mizuhopecten yessoensis]